MRLQRRLIRIVFTFLHGLYRSARSAAGRVGEGVHAVPLTGEGRVVLVRLTYAPGWRLPGGGRKRSEAPEEAMLRELREEIGLVSHGAVDRLDDIPEDRSALFLVRAVAYRPRRSLEVEAVREFDPEALPEDTARWTLEVLERLRGVTPRPGAPAGG
jgi:8-oxo-dGTP pyrophosphatase MutT (NUDIX family)